MLMDYASKPHFPLARACQHMTQLMLAIGHAPVAYSLARARRMPLTA